MSVDTLTFCTLFLLIFQQSCSDDIYDTPKKQLMLLGVFYLSKNNYDKT